jgi:hypothetical protein
MNSLGVDGGGVRALRGSAAGREGGG